MRKNSREKEQRLNDAVCEWAHLPAADTDRKDALWSEIILLALALYDDGSELFLAVLQEALARYSPEKGPFSHYLAFVFSRRKKDACKDMLNNPKNILSLDQPFGEDGTDSWQDHCPASRDTHPEELFARESAIAELTAQILNFAQRHQGQAANERRREWFRMFYTEDMTVVLKMMSLNFLHARDVFEAMLLPYLDYYMASRCRTLPQIAAVPLKPYGEVVPERAGVTAETPVPLPADVSLSFKRICRGEIVGASARSEQYKRYKAEKETIREMLRC